MHQKAYKIVFSNLKGYQGINGNVKLGPNMSSEHKWMLTSLLHLFLGQHMFRISNFVLLSRRHFYSKTNSVYIDFVWHNLKI